MTDRVEIVKWILKVDLMASIIITGTVFLVYLTWYLIRRYKKSRFFDHTEKFRKNGKG